jgi:hypothetical protein
MRQVACAHTRVLQQRQRFDSSQACTCAGTEAGTEAGTAQNFGFALFRSAQDASLLVDAKIAVQKFLAKIDSQVRGWCISPPDLANQIQAILRWTRRTQKILIESVKCKIFSSYVRVESKRF